MLLNNIELLPSYGVPPAHLARFFFSGHRITTVELSEIIDKKHSNVLRSVRDWLSGLSEANRDALFIDLGSYEDAQGKERPLYIFGQEAMWLLIRLFEFEYQAAFTMAMDACREEHAMVLREDRDIAEKLVMHMQTFDKRSPYFGRTDIRALQRAIAAR